jgi:hypothetical protein
MIMNRNSHKPFRELPPEARVLFSIYAFGALARYGARRPDQSELVPALEIIWNWNMLCLEDLSDPFRMTIMLIEHFALNQVSEDMRGAH